MKRAGKYDITLFSYFDESTPNLTKFYLKR